ncbi:MULTISPECIES: ABC transporter permease [unclassified Cohnella]|uniref:fluoroquinolone export ABC transporter permease subunit n=1 Tax=unclassified Cohnella TaxID=2636738 RepID=UPI00117ED446|nr:MULTISPECIES: ABC transporter permease [unclassified Cohnella]
MFLFDIRFQWKHGFYLIYSLICIVYFGILYFVHEDYVEKSLILLTFSDPSALGLLFAGGIILLERGQGVMGSLFATPVRIREYVLAKCLSLSCLSVLAAYAIHLPIGGWPVSPVHFTIGVALTSSFFTLIGIWTAVQCRSINSFILLTQLYVLPFVLPLAGYLDWMHSPFMALLPTHGTLILLDGAIRVVGWQETIYAILSLVLWIGGFGWLTNRAVLGTVRKLDGGKSHE